MNLIVLFAILSLTLGVNCGLSWCPCEKSDNNMQSRDITKNECHKVRGQTFYISEDKDVKCECCVIFRKNKESCKPLKFGNVNLMCDYDLECDDNYVCRPQLHQLHHHHKKRHHVVVVVKGEPSTHKQISDDKIGQSFDRSFGDMLETVFGCDCSRAKCQAEITRQECEQQQGLFFDKQSVKGQCQCCDKCYVPIGHHQKCDGHKSKSVQFVCDTGLYCSPFTHMCIEKSEIFSQFMNKFEKDNKETEDFEHILSGHNEQGAQGGHSFFFRLKRQKRDMEKHHGHHGKGHHKGDKKGPPGQDQRVKAKLEKLEKDIHIDIHVDGPKAKHGIHHHPHHKHEHGPPGHFGHGLQMGHGKGHHPHIPLIPPIPLMPLIAPIPIILKPLLKHGKHHGKHEGKHHGKHHGKGKDHGVDDDQETTTQLGGPQNLKPNGLPGKGEGSATTEAPEVSTTVNPDQSTVQDDQSTVNPDLSTTTTPLPDESSTTASPGSSTTENLETSQTPDTLLDSTTTAANPSTVQGDQSTGNDPSTVTTSSGISTTENLETGQTPDTLLDSTTTTVSPVQSTVQDQSTENPDLSTSTMLSPDESSTTASPGSSTTENLETGQTPDTSLDSTTTAAPDGVTTT